MSGHWQADEPETHRCHMPSDEEMATRPLDSLWVCDLCGAVYTLTHVSGAPREPDVNYRYMKRTGWRNPSLMARY